MGRDAPTRLEGAGAHLGGETQLGVATQAGGRGIQENGETAQAGGTTAQRGRTTQMGGASSLENAAA